MADHRPNKHLIKWAIFVRITGVDLVEKKSFSLVKGKLRETFFATNYAFSYDCKKIRRFDCRYDRY